MKVWFICLLSIVFCLAIGFSSGQFQTEAMATWYPTLNKSSLTPPGFVFPVVWTLLYICIGLSLFFILTKKPEQKSVLLALWALQMVLNFIWSYLFFYLQNPMLGFIDIVVLDVVVLLFILFSLKNILVSSVLFMPYLLWLILASYLNGYILYNN